MNVLIISAVFKPEPVVSANLSFDLAEEMSKDCNVVVFSPRPTRPLGFKFKAFNGTFNFKHIVTTSFTCPRYNVIGRLYETISFGKHCYGYIIRNKDKFSVIYSNTWPLFAQYCVVMAGKKCKIPVVIHVQDIYPESLTNILKIGKTFFRSILMPIDIYSLRCATKIVVISESMKLYLGKTRKIANEKFEIVYNWQDEESFLLPSANKKTEPVKATPFTFMYLGNIGPLAGVDLLIDAFLQSKLNDCRLIIAGSGSMKESLENHAKKFCNTHIEFWSVPDGKVPEIQNFADVMLLPMKIGGASNSIPSKLPAYMLSRKPVIACVDGGSHTAGIIRSAECGWILSPENIEELSTTMRKVIRIPRKELFELGNNGFKYTIEHLSKKKNLFKLISIIKTSAKLS